MKLLIVMWYDQGIAWYGDSNYKINKAYCDKHGIELIRCNERRHHRHFMLERFPLILKYIHDYDYIMWIDADAHFYLDSQTIVDFIEKYNEYNFIFSKDFHVRVNTGVFIVKNTKYTVDFLTKWSYDDELEKNNTYPYWPDQGVLLDMYESNVLDIQNNSIIVDYGVLQHFYKEELPKFEQNPYILHLAGQGENIRYNHPLDYIKEHGC